MGIAIRGRFDWLGCLVALLTVVFMGPTSVAGESDRWQSLGPDGGDVIALAAEPAGTGTLYAASRGGVFASTDGGETWRPAGTDLPVGGVNDVAVAPGGAPVYAATESGLYSLPGLGETWRHEARGPSFSDRRADRVAIDPLDARRLWTVNSSALHRSDDAGGSWQRAFLAGWPGVSVLAVDPRQDRPLYGGGIGFLRRSTDGGASFDLVDVGIEDAWILDLAFDPVSPTTLYAAAWRWLGRVSTVLVSTDGGSQWQPVGSGLPAELWEDQFGGLVAASGTPGTLYAGGRGGMYRSTDGGRSWAAIATFGSADVQALELVPASPETVFAGVSAAAGGSLGGVRRSRDSGQTWVTGISGLRGMRIAGLTALGGGALLASNGAGELLASNEARDLWLRVDPGLAEPERGELVRGLADPAVLYTWGNDLGSARARVYSSHDDGASWSASGQALPCCIRQLVADPHAEGGLYALLAGAGADLYQRTSEEASWRPVSGVGQPRSPSALAVDPASPATLYLGTSRDSGIPVSPPIIVPQLYRSRDDGDSWQVVGEFEYGSVFAGWTFAAQAAGESPVWAAYQSLDGGGVLRSESGGDSWTQVLSGVRGRALVVDPRIPGRVVVGGEGSGVWASGDGGSTWSPFGLGLGGADVTALAIDPTTEAGLLAGTRGGGVFAHSGTACTTSAASLCLGGRFSVEVEWQTPDGGGGSAAAEPLTDRGGFFWFFRPGNAELFVKVLDGREINGHYWVFFGSLTDLAFTLTVTDTISGQSRVYQNPAGELASRGDTRAFAIPGASSATAPAPGPANASAAGPTPGIAPTAVPLALGDGRYRFEVEWQAPQGTSGFGTGIPLTPDSGYFTFFGGDNVELVVKLLDGSLVNGRIWIFYGSLTHVAFTLTVTDTETGEQRIYTNPQGSFGSRGDTAAFESAP